MKVEFKLPELPELHTKRVVLVKGTTATNIKSGRDYDTISVAELLTIERTHVPKADAQFIIGSSYNASDARVHSAQRENGIYHLLYADLDKGNVLGKVLAEVVQRFVGNGLFRIYSSSSATHTERKWRVMVPIKGEFRYETWRVMQSAFFRFLERELGIEVDYAMERSAQPVYLPNTAPRSDGVEPLVAEKVAGAVLFDFFAAPEASALFHERKAEIEREAKAHEEQVAQAKIRLAQHRAATGGERTVIEAFDEAHDVEDLLQAYGYRRKGGNWRSPHQTSDSFATTVFNDGGRQFWISRSETDAAVGLGRPARSGGCSGDAFDLFCHFEHGNNHAAAIKAAANRMGMASMDSTSILMEIAAKMRQSTLQRAEQYRQENGIADPGVPLTPFDQKLMGERPRPEAMTADEFDEIDSGWPEVRLNLREVPPVRWLIDSIIGHTMMTVAGKPGGGKTTVLLALLLIIAGFKIHDRNVEQEIKASTRRKVIIVSEDLEQIQRSLAGYCKRFGLDPDEVNEWVITVPAKRASPEELLRLAINVDRHTVIHPKGFPVAPVLVLDTASATWDLDNENDNSEVARYVAAIKETLHIALDAPVIVVTHTPKNGNDDEDAESRGASAFRGDFRTTAIVFADKSDSDSRVFKLLKRRYEPLHTEIAFQSDVIEETAVDENGQDQVVRCRIAIPMPSSPEERRKKAAAVARDEHKERITQMALAFTRSLAADLEQRGQHKAFIQVGRAMSRRVAESMRADGWVMYDHDWMGLSVKKSAHQTEVKAMLDELAGWERSDGLLKFTLARWKAASREF